MCQHEWECYIPFSTNQINVYITEGVVTVLDIITVVDARMGRGKSSAAIGYMNRFKGKKRFFYITPFLDEVDRICEQCNCDQSDGDRMSKSTELKTLMRRGKNIAATHSLFYLMDDEALDLVRDHHYSLIIDESIQVVEKLNVTPPDLELITTGLADVDDEGLLRWKECEYQGVFRRYKDIADSGSLMVLDSALLKIMNPRMLRAFDEVFMLTYIFDGQYEKAYLDYFGFKYRIVGVIQDDGGFSFSDAPDIPPPVDYHNLINIVDDSVMNSVGKAKHALSMSWFQRRGYDDPDMRALRNNLRKFYQKFTKSTPASRLWTSFKSHMNKLVESKSGRFRNNFLQLSARATNEYRNRTDVAYIANRFIDPNLHKFFATKGISVDADRFALAEMLQWIWRSAIRDNKPINLYIPSSRMRKLLCDWIDEVNKGEI